MTQMCVTTLKYNTMLLCIVIVIHFCMLDVAVTVLSIEQVESHFQLQNSTDVSVINLYEWHAIMRSFYFLGGRGVWVVILALFMTVLHKSVLLLYYTLLCSVSSVCVCVCVPCLWTLHLPVAVPDVNKSGQGILLVTVILYVSCIK